MPAEYFEARERALLGQVADLPRGNPMVGDGTRLRLRQPEQALKQGAFPGTVRPDDAEVIPLFHRKGKVLHRNLASVSHGQMAALDHRHQFSPSRRFCAFCFISDK